ncbi:mixed lineage kinase domain-like protein [Branchiostoma floridae x Branchiostoma belcheri]
MADPIGILGNIFTIYQSIKEIVKEVECNKKRCKRLEERLDSIVPIIDDVKNTQITTEKEKKSYENALTQLESCLRAVKSSIQTFKKKGFKEKMYKVLNRNDVKNDFDDWNRRLSDLIPVLSLGMQAESLKKVEDDVLNKERMEKEDEEDDSKDSEQMLILLKEKKTEMETMNKEQDKQEAELEAINKAITAHTDPGKMRMHPVDDLKNITQITADELKPYTLIKEGQPISLYKAKYQRCEVAVKKWESESVCIYKPGEVLNEATIMKKVETENVVRLYGICTDPGNYFLVMEYMHKGSLKSVLMNKDIELTWKRRIRMAMEAARGLYALHNAKKPMLHRNMSSKKFLVNEDLHVKICDFGFTKTLSSARRTDSKGSLQYIAPEQLDLSYPTDERCEVFALGIVMWEIVTRAEPYAGMDDLAIIKYIMEKKREPIPDEAGCPSQFRDIIDSCKQHDPLLRPSTGELIDGLQILYNSM